MGIFKGFSESNRLVPTVAVVAVVLLVAWMGNASGGYFTSDWASASFIMATIVLIGSVTGLFRRTHSRWSLLAFALFAAYVFWTFLSILWSPNRGDAWLGAGQTLLYFLAFWIVANFVALRASRRWVLAALTLGPAVVAAFTLSTLISRADELFKDDRLIGTVGYYNGEAAFLLVSFWVAIYLAGSRQVESLLRGAILAGAVLCVDLAVLTQSRGAMVAMAVSLPIFFLLSGQRLRGLLALLPVAAALFIVFPYLNNVYLELSNRGSPISALERVLPTIWLTAAGVGLYGLVWGLIDKRWRPPKPMVKAVGSLAFAGAIVLFAIGATAAYERIDDPATFVQQKWEAFKTNDQTGQEQSRYLSVSGQGRYTYWQVAWEDFTSHPLLGIGTHNYEATYYQSRGRVAGWVRQPHMLPLEVLAERGIVGGVLFFGFLATCLATGLSKRFRRLGSEGKAQVGAMSAAIAYWFVHSGVDWFWQMPAVTLPAIVYLAMLVAPWRQADSPPLRWPLRAVGAGVAVTAIIVVAPLYLSDRYLVQSQANANPWEALAAIEKAQRLNPVNPRLPQWEAELAIKIGDWPRAEASYERAIKLNPRHFSSYKLLGMFSEKMGDTGRARSLYHEAQILNPLDQDIDQRLSQLDKLAADGSNNSSSQQ